MTDKREESVYMIKVHIYSINVLIFKIYIFYKIICILFERLKLWSLLKDRIYDCQVKSWWFSQMSYILRKRWKISSTVSLFILIVTKQSCPISTWIWHIYYSQVKIFRLFKTTEYSVEWIWLFCLIIKISFRLLVMMMLEMNYHRAKTQYHQGIVCIFTSR